MKLLSTLCSCQLNNKPEIGLVQLSSEFLRKHLHLACGNTTTLKLVIGSVVTSNTAVNNYYRSGKRLMRIRLFCSKYHWVCSAGSSLQNKMAVRIWLSNCIQDGCPVVSKAHPCEMFLVMHPNSTIFNKILFQGVAKHMH